MITYAILGTAKAKPGTKYTAHEEHAVIVLALAADPRHAEANAVNHLESTGWYGTKFSEIKLIDVERLNSMDQAFRDAYELTQKMGTHGIIFRKS